MGVEATVDVEKFVALAKGGPKEVPREQRPRLRELRQLSRDHYMAGRFSEALPMIIELAEMTADPNVLRRLGRTLRHLGQGKTGARIVGALDRRSEEEKEKEREWRRQIEKEAEARLNKD